MDKYIGEILGGRYEVREIIGTGGMAMVYKAYCTILHRYVAIKMLKEEFSSDEEFRRRFYNEAQAVAKLSHNNIVSIYDVSQGGEAEYIVMELCEGITLKEYLRQKQHLTWQETLYFAQQVAKALAHAHSRGIIHQDIKPQNIMLLRDGTCKVMDFGIASFANSQETRKVTSEAIGSVHYISPEQAKGIKVDYRTDLYSLGIVMYEMLTGTMPFRGDSAVAVVMQHLNTIPPRPSELMTGIPPAMDEIVMHAMCANLDKRYSSAQDMFSDMERLRANPNLVLNYSGSYADPTLAETRAIHYDEEKTQYIPIASRDDEKTAYMPPVPPQTPYRPQPEYQQDYQQQGYTGAYPPQKSSGGALKKVLIVVAAVLVVIGGAYGVSRVLWHQSNQGELVGSASETIAVPSLIGKNYEKDVENNTDYEQFEFTVVTQEVADGEYSAGEIIQQDPEEGAQVAPGTTIRLTVATIDESTRPVSVPDLTNKTYKQAKNALNKLGLEVEKVEEYSDSVEKGRVIETDPEAGGEALPGDVVAVTVSKGPEQPSTVKVPDLTGLTQSSAESLLERFNLSLGSVNEEESDKTAGTVIGQTVAANTEVATGTSVGITIAKKPEDNEPEEPEEPEETPVSSDNVSVSYDGSSKLLVSLPDTNEHRVTISVDGNTLYSETVRQGRATCRVSYSGTKPVVVTVDGNTVYSQDIDF